MPLHLGGIPLHRVLIHPPLALWLLAPLADAGYLLGMSQAWWRAGFLLGLIGAVCAAPAILAGAIDAVSRLQRGLSMDTLWQHIAQMFGAWALFCLAAALSKPGAPGAAELAVCTTLHVAGAALLLAGAGRRVARIYA